MRTRSTLFLEISRGLLKKLTKVDFSPISRKKAPKWIPLKFLPIPPPPYYIYARLFGGITSIMAPICTHYSINLTLVYKQQRYLQRIRLMEQNQIKKIFSHREVAIGLMTPIFKLSKLAIVR